MIVFLGLAMIAVFMFLIMTKRTTPVVALILVPGVLAVIAQISGAARVPNAGVTGAILDSIRGSAGLRDYLLRTHVGHSRARKFGLLRRRRLDNLHHHRFGAAAGLLEVGPEPGRADRRCLYGQRITPVEMGRASIVGQPVHMTRPLVPATLLLISLASVDLADFHKK